MDKEQVLSIARRAGGVVLRFARLSRRAGAACVYDAACVGATRACLVRGGHQVSRWVELNGHEVITREEVRLQWLRKMAIQLGRAFSP